MKHPRKKKKLWGITWLMALQHMYQMPKYTKEQFIHLFALVRIHNALVGL